ncbi:MAG: TIGR00730 family Rossman fold protein [Hyphomicrobiaceae bacterium]|nr:TIGR00730 family Rossman fold protein [Hyphomicrobiaceae bacterium]
MTKHNSSKSGDDVGASVTPDDISIVRNICVYCGSGAGLNPAYAEAARTLGAALAAAGIGLVYGGGGLGLMGEVARATLAAGGRVTGIIPRFLTEKEHMMCDVTELIVTSDMHERKRLMFERSDAFVALPGGIGTLEELVEQLTWSQLGQHDKPIVVASIGGFWKPFLDLLGHMRDDEFIRNGINVRFNVVDAASDIVPAVLARASVRKDTVPDAFVTAKF